MVNTREIIDIPWTEAVRRFNGKGYYQTSSGKFKAKISRGNVTTQLGLFNTAMEAEEAVYQHRLEDFKNRLKEYGLNPEDGKVTRDRHLIFDNGMGFNFHAEPLNKNSCKKRDVQVVAAKQEKVINKLNAEFQKKVTKDLLDVQTLRRHLPKVGDTLMKRSRIPANMLAKGDPTPHPCVVTFVNSEKLWYQVEFTFGDAKWKECFKIPSRTYKYV